MSPPNISPHSVGPGMLKPDCLASHSRSAESFVFSCDFSAGGLNHSKTGHEKSSHSSRSRPRLMKTRRKQVGASQNGSFKNFDLGFNGFNGASSEVKLDGKLGDVFGNRNENSGSNMSTRNGDSNGCAEQFGNFETGGLGFGVNNLSMKRNNSFCGSTVNNSASNLRSGVGNFSFPPNEGSSNLDAQKENGTFSFGAGKTDSEINQNSQSGGDVFGLNTAGPPKNTNLGSGHFAFGFSESNAGPKSNFSKKKSTVHLRQPKVDKFRNYDNFEFVFGSKKYESLLNVNLDMHGFNRGRDLSFEDLENVKGSKFVLGKTVDQRKHCRKNMGKDESGKENTVPDMMGNDHVSAMFGSNCNETKTDIDLEGKTTCKGEDTFNFTICGKVDAGFEIKFQNACPDGAYVFGASKGNVGLNSGGRTEHVNQTSQVRVEKVDDCDISRKHSHNIGSNIKDKFVNSGASGVYFKKDIVNELSNEMKGLNIDDANEKQNFNLNLSANATDMFVFGRNQDNSDSTYENQPSENTSDTSHSSQNNLDSNRTHVQQSGGFCEKGEKEGVNSTSKVDNLNSSYADYNTPNMKFEFSNFSFSLGVDKTSDNANGKSLKGKKSKKSNGKMRKRTFVQDLFGKNNPSVGSSQLNSESPVFGSPMEFSPYQDSTSCNAPAKGKETGIDKEKIDLDEKDAAQHCESPSLPAQDGLSSIRREYKKKYKLKVGPNKKFQEKDSNKGDAIQASTGPAEDGLSSIRREYKKKYKLKVDPNIKFQEKYSNNGDANQASTGLACHEVCEHWRIRGNQAYHDGKLSEAEVFYTTGIDSVQCSSNLGNYMKPLLLCYSNRAATRMSLGRLREAINDCSKAAALDPDFLKVSLRAGNCYLILGEVEDAVQCYEKCFESGIGVCLDRRITVEAADGLLKAKRVAEYICKSTKLLQEGTQDTARAALENIAEALSISRYSEKLLQMKGETLCILRMYDEVIELCEKSLHIANKNFIAGEHEANRGNYCVKLWRWHLQAKCYYHIGKLELSLDMIEQGKVLAGSMSGDVNQESSTALTASIQELLCLKKSGNEAFHSGRYTEAVEHYTTAISKSVESHPFMAICFCNRAAAYQSMSQIVDAIADCSLAIALDENYQKAISRRATLHEMIRDYKQAANDLQRLITLLENRSQAKIRQNDSQGKSSGGNAWDLRKARRHISLMEDKAKKEVPLDLYLILGIKASDTESEIKKAYRKAALRHHPDKAGQVLARSDVGKEVGERIHNDADRLFKVIGEAYAVLSDPSKRSKYDNEEEMRSASWNSNRNDNSSGRPSTSYSSSPYGTTSSSGRQPGFGTERNSRRWHWYNARSYDSPYS